MIALFLGICASRSHRYFSVREDCADRHRRLIASVPAGSTVIADLTFVFDEIETHDLRGLWAYRIEAEGEGREFDLRWLSARAREDQVDAILLDRSRELPRRLARSLAMPLAPDASWEGWRLSEVEEGLLLSAQR